MTCIISTLVYEKGVFALAETLEFERLRPAQIAVRIEQTPVAYLPIGILEWHSLHNPYGLDGLKAKGIALRLAAELGGLVMPTMFWGDNRAEICEIHLDRNLKDHPVLDPSVPDYVPSEVMCETLQVERDAFQKDAARARENGGWQLFEALLLHTLYQIETYGFSQIVVIPGHYPLFSPVQAVLDRYRQAQGRCRLLMLNDSLYDAQGKGDHAAAYETSLMMALDPDTVDLDSADPTPGRLPIGCALGRDPREYASQAEGEAAIARLLVHMKQEIEKGA